MKTILVGLLIVCPTAWVLAWFGSLITASYKPSPSDPPSYLVPQVMIYLSPILICVLPVVFTGAIWGLRRLEPKPEATVGSLRDSDDASWPPPPSARF
jgi:hypothetical protein